MKLNATIEREIKGVGSSKEKVGLLCSVRLFRTDRAVGCSDCNGRIVQKARALSNERSLLESWRGPVLCVDVTLIGGGKAAHIGERVHNLRIDRVGNRILRFLIEEPYASLSASRAFTFSTR